MLTDRIRQRLEALHRTEVTPTPGDRVKADKLPRTSPGTPAHEPGVLAGQEVTNPWGSHWLLRQPIAEIWPASHRYLPDRWPAESSRAEPSPVEPGGDADLVALRRCFPQRAVCLDLETCGFAGSMIFLVGLLHWDPEGLVLSQLWARSYAEEKAILQSLWMAMRDVDLLVTFNGKCFDWPQVHDRSTLHHVGYRAEEDDADDSPSRQALLPWPRASAGLTPRDPRPEPWHLDLLHHARRRWRSQLPNCRLQTLERYLCGRHRVGDLPGSQIPQAYHDYVRTGKADQVRAILHHNALDLVTLLQLALLFLADDDDSLATPSRVGRSPKTYRPRPS